MYISPLNRLTGFIRPVGTISGVAPQRAACMNGEGIATLASHNDGMDICFRAPGSEVFGPAVRCESDADYLLEDGEDKNKWIIVTVKTAFLRPTPQQARVFMRLQDGEMVTEQPPGAVANLSLRVENVSAFKLENVRVWCPTPGAVFFFGTPAATEATSISLGTIAAAGQVELDMQLTIPGIADPSPAELIEVFSKWQSF